MTHTADIVVAGAGHNSLITAAYLAKAGYECLVLDARADTRRRRRDRGAARSRLQDRLVLHGPHDHPREPAAHERRARPTRRLRARVPRARPRRARRLPGRGAADDVARPRPHLRGDRPLLGDGRRRVPAPHLRVRRGEGHLRARARNAARLRALARGDAARAPARAHLAAAQRDLGVGRDPARVRGSPRPGVHALAGVPDARPRGRRGLRRQRLLDRLRPPGAQLVRPARRVRRAHGRAHALPRGPRLHRALQPPGVPARPRGRALHGRRDGRRRALLGEARGALDDPREAPRRDGAARRVGRGVRLRSRHLRRRDVRHGLLPRHRRGAGVPDPGRPAGGGVGGHRRLAGGGARSRAGGARPAALRRGRTVAARGHADARRPRPRAGRVITRSSC